jgi:hypothetical protein
MTRPSWVQALKSWTRKLLRSSVSRNPKTHVSGRAGGRFPIQPCLSHFLLQRLRASPTNPTRCSLTGHQGPLGVASRLPAVAPPPRQGHAAAQRAGIDLIDQQRTDGRDRLEVGDQRGAVLDCAPPTRHRPRLPSIHHCSRSPARSPCAGRTTRTRRVLRPAKPRCLSLLVDEITAVNSLAPPVCGDGCHRVLDIEIKPSTSWFNLLAIPRRRAQQ